MLYLYKQQQNIQVVIAAVFPDYPVEIPTKAKTKKTDAFQRFLE